MRYYLLLIIYLLIFIQSENIAQNLKNEFDSFTYLKTADSLPADFPKLTIDVLKNPSPYFLFLGSIANNQSGNIYGNYLMILDSLCNPFAYKKVGMDLGKFPLNFMQAPNGNLVHIEKTPKLTTMYISDTTLRKIDSLPSNVTTIIQGYFELLSNGNLLVDHISDVIPMDFSKIYNGGEPNGTLQSSTLYEYDNKKNIVFEWKSPDYIPITETYTDSMLTNVPYVHINNIIQDFDGNYLVSSRHLSTIFKINRITGEIIWKLGGKHNEFTFINEHEENAPNYFSFQHDIRRLPNGNISIFDNGTQHNPKYSRAVEYKIDEVNRTATLVWEYRNSPDIYSVAQGSVQRLPNNNVLIFWGDAALSGGIAITEVKPDNSKALELRFPKNYKSLRVVKYPLKWSDPSVDVKTEVLEQNTYSFKKANLNSCVKITIKKLVESFYPMIGVQKFEFSPLLPEFEESIAPMVLDKRFIINYESIDSIFSEIRFSAECLGVNYQPERYKVYSRKNIGNGKFKQIPTNFDNTTKEWIINTSLAGEFILAVPQLETKPLSPILKTPVNNAKINKNKVEKLSWSTRGYFTHCQIQLALDENFNNIIKDTLLLGQLNSSISNLSSETKHYWRVRSKIQNSFSEWSEIRSFTPSDPYVLLSTPNGGEKWTKDSIKKIIRWNKNIDDLVKIELVKSGITIMTIKDSLNCPTGAYGWKIPANIAIDSTYKIRISSIINSNLSTLSENTFSIIDGITSVEEEFISVFEKFEISPNPASDRISIEIPMNNNFNFDIAIYNSIGIEVMRMNDIDSQNRRVIELSVGDLCSGLYYFTISKGNQRLTKSFIKIK